MAYVMQMRHTGVSKEQYDELRPIVQWETEHPDGAYFHVAYFADGAINVIDVWESPAHFERFMQERLGPGFQQVGITGEPDVSWHEAHAIYNPQALRAGAPA
jgi:hypothetical protein